MARNLMRAKTSAHTNVLASCSVAWTCATSTAFRPERTSKSSQAWTGEQNYDFQPQEWGITDHSLRFHVG